MVHVGIDVHRTRSTLVARDPATRRGGRSPTCPPGCPTTPRPTQPSEHSGYPGLKINSSPELCVMTTMS